jgi:hypothetical protein
MSALLRVPGTRWRENTVPHWSHDIGGAAEFQSSGATARSCRIFRSERTRAAATGGYVESVNADSPYNTPQVLAVPVVEPTRQISSR